MTIMFRKCSLQVFKNQFQQHTAHSRAKHKWLVKSMSSSFSKDFSHEAKAKDSTLKAKAKTKDFKIVFGDPRGRWLVLEDSNTDYYLLQTFLLLSYHSIIILALRPEGWTKNKKNCQDNFWTRETGRYSVALERRSNRLPYKLPHL